jgi:heterodisulfide reductase subunit B
MSDIQEQIKIAHRKALEQDFNEIIKELKQEEHKNLELSMRINKAIEYMNNYIEVEELNEPVKIEFKEVIKMLKGDNK